MTETTSTDPIANLQAAVDEQIKETLPKENVSETPTVTAPDTTSVPVSVPTVAQVTEAPPALVKPDENLTVVADRSLVDYLTNTYIHDPLEETPYTKLVLYGGMGGGKTKAACEAPSPLLIAVERGQSTLLNHPDILRNGIKVMKFQSVQQIEDFVQLVKKGYFEEYETIILDTFSELQYTALDNRVQQKWMEAPLSRDPYTPEGKDYQGNTGHMRRIAAAFRDIDRNVIFICHDKDVEKGAAKAVVRQPDTTDKVTDALNQYVDGVFYLWSQVSPDSGEESFYALTRNTQTTEARITAKTRIGSLDTMVQNLTFNMVHDAKLDQIEKIKAERANEQ